MASLLTMYVFMYLCVCGFYILKAYQIFVVGLRRCISLYSKIVTSHNIQLLWRC